MKHCRKHHSRIELAKNIKQKKKKLDKKKK